MHILLTGGTGYIGAHVCVALAKCGYRASICDNLSNSGVDTLDNIEAISHQRPQFEQLDLLDYDSLLNLFQNNQFDAVIHLAGLKSVAESVAHPERYQRVNVDGARNLIKAMRACGVYQFVFSSSATVYGQPKHVPIPESAKPTPINPYGASKIAVEHELQQLYKEDSRFKIAILRYFNPVGAHPSGRIGENPRGTPNNLMPYITQVAAGIHPELQVFGSDYDTPDGSGIRDYIHVCDLAEGHVAALQQLAKHNSSQAAPAVYNLGTGTGYSVLEVIRAFEDVNKLKVKWAFAPRRPGDLAINYANTELAEKKLGWRARLQLNDMCRDSWRWQQRLTQNTPT